MRLTNIEAEGIRGIPVGWPALPVGPKGLFLYGPNGTGKTSVVDALEFLLTRRSTLFSENRTGVNWNAAKQHIRASDVAACLTLTEEQTTVKVRYEQPIPVEAEEWCQSAVQSSFLLRRYMLLRFIDAQPKTRYEQLEPFLKLDEFVDFEERLSQIGSEIDAKKAILRSQITGKEQIIRVGLGLEPSEAVHETSVLRLLNEKLVSAGLERCSELTDCDAIAATVQEALKSDRPGERYLKLMRLRQDAQNVAGSQIYSGLLSDLSEALRRWEDAVQRQEKLMFTELLEAAKSAIDANSLTECPVCERAIDPVTLIARLQERIDADTRMASLRQDVVRRKANVSESIGSFHAKFSSLIDSCGEALISVPESYGVELALAAAILAALADGISSQEVAKFAVDLLSQEVGREALISVLDSAAESESRGQTRLALAEANASLGVVLSNWSTYQTQSLKMRGLDDIWAIADRVHETAVSARKKVVQDLLKDISQTANRMYEKIHPGEAISNSTLMVRSTEDGSVILNNTFYGRTSSPRLHLSESHLDTLGLCYFLALRRTEADKFPSFKCLVLDDVLHSVDADHRTRVAQLLKEEFSDHQLVVTTHDEVFFTRLKAAFGTGGIEYRKFHGWNITYGPLCAEATDDIDTINSPDLRMSTTPSNLAGAAGRAFEWMLRELTENLEVAITARFRRGQDIGNMWPPLSKKLRKMQSFESAHPNLCTDIEMHGWVRNTAGAHYNELASGVTPSEVRDFAALLSALYSATFCDSCGEFVKRDSDDLWKCAAGCIIYSRNAAQSAVHLISA